MLITNFLQSWKETGYQLDDHASILEVRKLPQLVE
jgi:hypothetical protein